MGCAGSAASVERQPACGYSSCLGWEEPGVPALHLAKCAPKQQLRCCTPKCACEMSSGVGAAAAGETPFPHPKAPRCQVNPSGAAAQVAHGDPAASGSAGGIPGHCWPGLGLASSSGTVPLAPALLAARTCSRHKPAQARPGGAPGGRCPPSLAVASLKRSKDLPRHTPEMPSLTSSLVIKPFFFFSLKSAVP